MTQEFFFCLSHSSPASPSSLTPSNFPFSTNPSTEYLNEMKHDSGVFWEVEGWWEKLEMAGGERGEKDKNVGGKKWKILGGSEGERL